MNIHEIFDNHLQDLEKSGITSETVIKAGLYSLRGRDLAEKLGFLLKETTTGLVFPYGNGYLRAKLFPPLEDMKYAQPKASATKLYLSPGFSKNDLSATLYITEGEKKLLKMYQEGLSGFAIGGLWNWMQGGEPIKDLDEIVWFGRNVVFMPDGDVWSRQDLLQAVYAFGMELQGRGAVVEMIMLPYINGGKVGLDDYLINNSVEDLKKLDHINLNHKGFAEAKKWYKSWVSKNKVDEKPGKPIHYAIFPELIEIATDNDKLVFLVLENGHLEVVETYTQDDSTLIPPPRVSIRWPVPRSDNVKHYYTHDSDKALYYDLVEYHKSISDLPTENHYHLLAAWDFHTYLFEKSEYSPMIWLYAIPERGKTRTGQGCMNVCYRGLHVESLREAYLLRAAENLKSALFIDVLNVWKKAEKLGSEDILLQRYEKGAVVPRVKYPDKPAHEDTVYYDIYGPTIIATNETVSEILASRAVQIIMPEADRKFEHDVKPEDALPLRERLTAFRARHLNDVLPDAEKPCRGRLGDILRPLRQIVLMVAPDEEPRFLSLCSEFENQRYESLEDSLEATILQAIVDLEDEIINRKLLSKKITEKINEDIPEKFQRGQRSVTQACKRMGFKAPRSCGETYIDVDPELLYKLCLRYLRKSALSALSAQQTENIGEFESTCKCSNSADKIKCTNLSADSAEGQNNQKQLHSGSCRNNCEYADSADSADNQSISTDKCSTCKAAVGGQCYGYAFFDGKSGKPTPCETAVLTCDR